MAKLIVIDEFHVTVSVLRGLAETEYEAIGQTLANAAFQTDLRRAIREVFRRYPALSRVRATLSR